MGLFDVASQFIKQQETNLARAADTLNPFGTGNINLVNPITGDSVAIPGARPVIAGLEATAAASYAAAGIIALGGGTVASTSAAIGKGAVSTFNSLSFTGKAATVIAAPAVGLALVKNPATAVSAAGSFASFENQLSDVRSVGDVVNLAKSHPALSGAAVLVGAGALAGGAATIVNALNTSAIKKNTAVMLASDGSPAAASAPAPSTTSGSPATQGAAQSSMIAAAPPSSPVAPPVVKKKAATKKKKKKKKAKPRKKAKKHIKHKPKKKAKKRKKK